MSKTSRFKPRNTPHRKPRSREWPVSGVLLGAAVFGGVTGVLLMPGAPPLATGQTQSQPQALLDITGKRLSIDHCGSGMRVTCVVDGDTFWLEGDKIRIANIDTPEVSSPRCASERAAGERATSRLVSLLDGASVAVSAAPGTPDRDRYDRALRQVHANGRDVGEVLIAEGLARRWDGARHPWC